MKVRYKIRAGAKRSELLLHCNYNPPGFLRNFYQRSHYSWTQRHADTLRQWLNEMLTPTKRSQPDMPTFSHVDMLAGSHVGMLYADTDLLKRLLPDALRRWHGDMVTCRLGDTLTLVGMLTCWFRHVDADILTCWQAGVLTCRRPEDTLMLTFWHADMQTCRHADVYTLTLWQADVLTCKRTDTLMLSCWQADLKRRWHVDILSH